MGEMHMVNLCFLCVAEMIDLAANGKYFYVQILSILPPKTFTKWERDNRPFPIRYPVIVILAYLTNPYALNPRPQRTPYVCTYSRTASIPS